jgi:hypothetical protein
MATGAVACIPIAELAVDWLFVEIKLDVAETSELYVD